MRYWLLFLLLWGVVVSVPAQERNASEAVVEEIKGIPFFMYAEPVEKYDVVGKAISFKETMKLAASNRSNVRQKAEKLVDMVLKKKKEDKLPPFDAIIVDIDRDKTHIIKFEGPVSRRARVKQVKDVPLYFFSHPVAPYDTVAVLPPDFSRWAKRNLLYDKINSMVGRVKKKAEKGEIGAFDALIYNPEDLSAVAIKFPDSHTDSLQLK